MWEDLIKSIEKGVSAEISNLTGRAFRGLRRRMYALILEIVLFSAASIFLLLGFIFLARNFFPVEYVLLVFGGVLFIALLIGRRT